MLGRRMPERCVLVIWKLQFGRGRIALGKEPRSSEIMARANAGRYGKQMDEIENIVILTGAGISAESGLATFRGPDGLWEGHHVEDVCTPEALARNADLVHRFYDERRAKLRDVAPNPAHQALAALDAQWPGELLVVTQNVDDLHERAGTKRLIHMHGELRSAICAACGMAAPWIDPLPPGVRCGRCGQSSLRPDIVFFGEMPYQMEAIDEALRRADLFVSIGTSGAVYPAAGFVQTARHAGARTLELNLEPSAGSLYFEESRIGPASRLVPELVRELLV
jgi:NAD-dependent deacetylase